jgi:two-component sensor histidine kinase
LSSEFFAEGILGRRSLPISLHLAIYGALILLPVVIAGLVVTKLYVDKEHAVLENQARSVVADATRLVDQELNRAKLALQVLASSSMLADGRVESFYLRAQALSEAIPDSSIALRRVDGETLFLTSEPFGEPIGGTPDPALRTADRLAVEHRSAVITDLVAGPMGGNVVALVVPVVTQGRVEHLLTLTLSPKGILDILKAQAQSSRWLLSVTDNNERVIARSWDDDRFAGEKAGDQFIRNTREKSGAFTAVTLEGVPVYNVYGRSDLSGWRIAAGIPLSELEAPLYRSLAGVAILAAIGLVGSLLIAFWYGRRLVRPLRQLQGVADARADKRVVPTGISELDGVTGILMRSLVVLKERDRARARTMKELDHRMKNMLAIIQAIAEQTRRRVGSLDQFGKVFESRLVAMARSHQALGDADWHSRDLGTLIAQTCKPFCDESRIELQGPAVELTPKAAIGIGMVIHELSTNAAKYGAFSTPAGKVRLQWDLPEEGGLRILRLQWQELNGPIVQSHGREGFGTSLLHSVVETDLGGKLDMIFARDGLLCIICVPAAGLIGPAAAAQPHDLEPATAG